MKKIQIALVKMRSPLGQVSENLKRILFFVSQAKAAGADIVCFPELSLTGYCSDSSVHAHTLSISSPEIGILENTARCENMVIFAGFAEQAPNGRAYATHLVVGPNGVEGWYRKFHIAPPERAAFISGDIIPVFEIQGWRFGIQLCYDAHFPELSTAMAEKGADAIVIPHASPRGSGQEKYESWMRHLPARAFDNSVYVLACNQNGENGNGLSFSGVSLVIDPSGRVAKKDIGERDGILMASLNRDILDSVRGHQMKYFFPNRRPSCYGTGRKDGTS